MKKRILVTGSNGFLGKSFIEGFNKNLYDIFALDFKDKFSGDIQGIKDYFSVDISKSFNLNMNFDVVIHLAALNQTNINSDFSYRQFENVNVNGTKNVANCCKFKKFIFFSTANLYERNENQVDENSTLKPSSFYERSKYEAELVCKEYIDNEKLVILRPVNVTGVKQENKAIVPFFFSRAVKHESIEIFVPKNKKIQLLSVRDLLSAIEDIICKENATGIFNLSNKDSIEVKTLAEKITTLCNSKSTVTCTNDNLENYVEISSDKAKQLLNWQAKDSIDIIIKDFAKTFLSQ
ncbi:NAD-dependent epimerase/dehydratase family protein [Clostridium estertheticum]|uniref:NAD-dependent epimerase/dehydratase family protein n=1 Tax=Clostridium estertheticum TaxID=238834 RepID=UPI001C7CF23D|nr:NAD(P)-dependent oxidoreductase [Clostridium estertheticum]MBX4264174.1 NAD(P)-dependent oxidoreductase [Clostridium estertheticum]WLC89033.1 NAD(P)-dependent oxidoreductase [Clostridium estertheticum]